MHSWLKAVLIRELETLKRELLAYPSEEQVWTTPPGIANSAGTLALHLAGNLQHYVGGVLGGTGYVRDRTAEFAQRDVSRAGLAREVDKAIAAVDATLSRSPGVDLSAPFPEVVGGQVVTTGDFLLHLASHAGYHLGQVDYHRRLIAGSGTSVGAVSIAALSTAIEAGKAG